MTLTFKPDVDERVRHMPRQHFTIRTAKTKKVILLVNKYDDLLGVLVSDITFYDFCCFTPVT